MRRTIWDRISDDSTAEVLADAALALLLAATATDGLGSIIAYLSA
jgi:hypothetical protein